MICTVNTKTQVDFTGKVYAKGRKDKFISQENRTTTRVGSHEPAMS